MYNSKIVFISIIFTAALLLLINVQNKNIIHASTSIDESSSTFSSNLPTLNNTTNYTMYHDERIGISFDYPVNWTINENINRFASVSTVEVYNDNRLNSFKVIKSQSSSDTELVDKLGGLGDVLEILLPSEERIIEPINDNKYTIDGEDTSSALTVIENRPSLPDLGVERIILIHQDMLYTLIYQDTTDSFDSSTSQQIFNYIINSFEFVDSPTDNNDDNDNDNDVEDEED